MQHECQSTFRLCVLGEDRCGRKAKANNGENKGAGHKAATQCSCRHRLTDQERHWCTRLGGRKQIVEETANLHSPWCWSWGQRWSPEDVKMDGAVISSLVSINRPQHLHHLRKWDRRKMEREKQNKGSSQKGGRRERGGEQRIMEREERFI